MPLIALPVKRQTTLQSMNVRASTLLAWTAPLHLHPKKRWKSEGLSKARWVRTLVFVMVMLFCQRLWKKLLVYWLDHSDETVLVGRYCAGHHQSPINPKYSSFDAPQVIGNRSDACASIYANLKLVLTRTARTQWSGDWGIRRRRRRRRKRKRKRRRKKRRRTYFVRYVCAAGSGGAQRMV